MRYTPLTGPLRNIRRVDYVKRIGKGKTGVASNWWADLIKLIEKVFVAPDAPVWFFELVKKVTERYEQGSIPVVQSSLSATPFY